MISLTEIMTLPKGVNVAVGHCETHGDYKTVARDIDTPKCPHCLQTKIEKEAREAHELERTAHLYKISNLPARYAEASIQKFQQLSASHETAVKALIAWVRQQKAGPQNLVITGGVGTGKTHLVCAALRNLMHNGISVRYETASSLLHEIKRAYKDEALTEASQIDSYANHYNVLAIDEADINRATDNDMNLIFAVINGRYNAMRSIVVVSNQSPASMPKWLGERSADRVMEGAAVVSCDWGSYRNGPR